MKYKVFITVISAVVAVLVHFPEIISLSSYGKDMMPFGRIHFWDVASEVGFLFLSLLLLFWLNAIIFRFNTSQTKIKWSTLVVSFLFTWLINSLLGHIFVMLREHGDMPAIDATLHHYLHPLRDFIISCVVAGGSYIIYLVRRQQSMMVENQELRTENLRNQYEALKNQLNPHMFFNSLNTLNTLIRESPQKAQSYTCELSKVLRYTLQTAQLHDVSLNDELGFVRAYIYLLKTRYEDNLNFEINIPNALLNCKLPPMAIQMLIENAVKHNEISNKKPLTITITANNHTVTVSNPIHRKIGITHGEGIGLHNLNKRYELIFKKQIVVGFDQHNYNVTLPLIPRSDERTDN